jgi:hypothetical protein
VSETGGVIEGTPIFSIYRGIGTNSSPGIRSLYRKHISDREGVFYKDAEGNRKLLLAVGQQVAGETTNGIGSPELNENGAVAVVAILFNACGPITKRGVLRLLPRSMTD